MTPFEDLIRQAGAQTESLSEMERSRMRTLLAEYAQWQPVRAAAPQSRLQRFSHLLMRPAFAAALAFALLATGGGAVAYAAEGSVPGDLLYPVKVGINEPVVTALTPSGEAQASWQLALAKRRINEAATLLAEGRLATSTAAELAAQAAGATLKSVRDAVALSPAATTTASTTAELATAVELLAEGQTHLKQHDDAEAARAFTAAIHAAASASTFARAAAGLDLQILDDASSTPTSTEDASTTPASAAATSTASTTFHGDRDRATSTASTTASTNAVRILRHQHDGERDSPHSSLFSASSTLRSFFERE